MKVINKACVLCLESHTEVDCPELHVTNRITDAILRSECFGREQQRVTYRRRKLCGRRVIER